VKLIDLLEDAPHNQSVHGALLNRVHGDNDEWGRLCIIWDPGHSVLDLEELGSCI